MHILALWLVLILVLPSNARTRVRRSAPEEMAGLFEGDIVISEKEKELLEDGKASAGIIGSHFRWPQATVPYTISNDFSRSDVQTMQAAMSEISAKTCIRFKPHGGERHSIFIQDGYGCSSEVGRREPMQEVTLSRGGCITKGTVIHELVHAIGFWHEQSRTDRDNYVTVNLRYVPQEHHHNFNKRTTQEAYDFGVPYDYDSVMHYQDTAFVSEEGLRRGAKSVVPKKPGVKIGNRLYLSEMDALKINQMYECSGQIQTKTRTTESPIMPVGPISPIWPVGPIDHRIRWPFFFGHKFPSFLK